MAIHFKNRKNYDCLILLLVLMLPFGITAQDNVETEKDCAPKTLFELFKKKDSIIVVKPVKNSFFLVIPVIGSQPATGFMFGAVAQYTFKGPRAEDKYSLVNLGVTYTAKKQLLINMKNNLLLKNNKIFMSGDYRYYIFSQSNWGLGTDIIPKDIDDFSIDSLEQPMDYNYFKFHQTVSFEVRDHLYVGAGINIDWYSSIVDKELDVANGQFTYHYNYSQKYGFDPNQYFVNGFSFNMVYDSRDNQVNARKGWFANLNYRFNADIFNEQDVSHVMYTEFRKFIPFKNEKYVLAFWAYGQFVVKGQVPYLNLPAIGWDQRSRSGEGYTQGLFRGYNLAYFSTEFRFPITCNQMVGGTVFANMISAGNKEADIRLFEHIQPAIGVGLRILIDKASRTNLILDIARGRDSKGFYLNAGETF
jgi:outer membrane protein assembly factor BamA